MSRAASELFEVQEIANAGRGVIATQCVPAGTVILESGPPAFHVILKPYAKETCANCFLWDRGRTLPVRDNDAAKFFCSGECQVEWMKEQGTIGVEAWRCVAAYVRMKGKGTDNDDVMNDGLKPAKHTIDTAWKETELQAKVLRQSRMPILEPVTKADRKRVQAVLRRMSEVVDPDVLCYLLSGTLFHHKYPRKWHREVLDLAMDEQGYKTHTDLTINCSSYLQLLSIVPVDLLDSLTADLCRNMVRADNHNAFGIRAGETGEEYMGYGVYPVASYFNHSCKANLDKRRVGNSWHFTAAKDILPGEECCITYLGGDEKDMSRSERQNRLKDFWGFACACQLCVSEAVRSP